MRSSLGWKWLSLPIAAFVVALGCSFSSSDNESNDDVSVAGNDFSDAPVSPGGTGGTVDDIPELKGEETRSFFKAFQIDPEAEDTAGPKFVVAADIDQDGLLDLVSGWNQSQPVQLHLQRRDASGNISFRAVTIAGTTPVAVMAGVEVGQINNDGWLDIVVLSKATGFATFCPPQVPGEPPSDLGPHDGEILVYFSPGAADLIPDGDRWTEMTLVNPYIADVWIHDQFPGSEEKAFTEGQTHPEWNGFTALAVGNIDGVEGDDIVVALNPAECETLGQLPPSNTVDIWFNPGPGLSEQFALWGAPDPDNPGRNVPLSVMADAPQVKDITLIDVDGDTDLDVIATYTNAISMNLRWARNPLVPHNPGGPSGLGAVQAGFSDGWRLYDSQWQIRPIAAVDTAADVIAMGDVDGDGFQDVVMRSTNGGVVQWFRHPNALLVEPEFPPNDEVPDRFNFPWPVFTLTEFSEILPEAIACGDVTGDDRLDVVVAAGGAVLWMDGTTAPTVFDPWFPNTIIQDGEPPNATQAAAAAAPGAGLGVEQIDTSTSINTLLVVDLDSDGRNDIIATLDRRTNSGLSDDRLVWYRNTRTDAEEAAPRPAKEPRPTVRVP